MTLEEVEVLAAGVGVAKSEFSQPLTLGALAPAAGIEGGDIVICY